MSEIWETDLQKGKTSSAMIENTDEFLSEKHKQLDHLKQKLEKFFVGNTAIIHDKISTGENENLRIVKLSGKVSTVWQRNVNAKSKFADKWVCTSAQVDMSNTIGLYVQILLYYLLNPYIILDPKTDSNPLDKAGMGQSLKINWRVYLTENRHKYRIRRGINVLDTTNDCVHCGIVQAAKFYNTPYNSFYYGLHHGDYPNLQRIERMQILPENE